MTEQTTTTRKITTEEAEACASEKIHLIGNIQPHGFQLILDPEGLRIVQYSENFIPLLNEYQTTDIPLSTQVLDGSIDTWLRFSDPNAMSKLTRDKTQKIELSSNGLIAHNQWECIGHLADKWVSLEFIPTSPDAYDSFSLLSKMNNMIEVLRAAENTQEIFDRITTEFQQYTQFDRVMIYRFLPDFSGEVVSEAVSEAEEPKFLNLRFPSDDIPKQARELYKKNKVRVFANSEAEPALLVPSKLPDGSYLNQGHSLLRNMSDMHRTYLVNMGVKATLSLSLLVDNELWGLIVFHHNTPKTPPNHIVAQLKLTCELFSEIISSYLMPAIHMYEITYLMNVKNRIESIFNKAKKSTYSKELFEESLKEIYDTTGYDYIGIILGDSCFVSNKGKFTVFSKETITAISTLFSDAEQSTFQSHQLQKDHIVIPGLEEMFGIFVMRSKIPSDFYVFFGQNEVIKNVNWSGKPNTVNIVVKDNQRHLEPRSSFALWREKVRGQCEYWTDQDNNILEAFYTLCKDFTSVKRTELLMKELEKNAHFDSLTGLANRTYFKVFIESLKQSEDKKIVSLLFIDLDNFKDVNDFMGHDTGDRLLVTIAERLQEFSRPEDLVVRLGGDEFIVVFTHDEEQELTSMAENIVHHIGEPIFDHGHTIVITPSIGIISSNVEEVEFNEMLKRADIAMYSAKNKGKNSYHVFDSRDQDAFNKKAILTIDLREYIESSDIELHFQAQCDYLKNITGAEALARWNHPKFGYINPEVFIEIAEMNNLIKPLSIKIFKEACEQLSNWYEHDLSDHFETLSINISPSLLLNKEFQHEITKVLSGYPKLKPENFRLEITESIFMQNHDLSIANLNSLRDQGFSISLDDFGTGYSSLNHLWKLPIDEVKIDRSFISSMSQDESLFTMVESIIELCKKLRLEVVAEGVESNVEFNLLKGLDCETCQGYFFSKPMPSQSFIENFIVSRHDIK